MNHIQILTIAIAMVSGPGLWGILQLLFTHRKSQREEQRQHQKDIIDEQRAADERRELLAEAQQTAQRTALESADSRFAALHEDFKEVQTALISVRSVAWLLIDVLEGFLNRAQPVNGGDVYSSTINLVELASAKQAITDARLKLR